MPRKKTPKPRRPSKLKVGYTDIRVRVSRDLEGVYGEYQGARKLILLDRERGAHGPDGVNTLLHELLHAGYDLGELKNSGLSADEAKHDEERVVTVLANHLTELFRRNRGLLRWIEAELGNGE